jgi:hypothetical protein
VLASRAPAAPRRDRGLGSRRSRGAVLLATSVLYADLAARLI